MLKIGQFVAVSDLGNLQTVNEASRLTDKQKKKSDRLLSVWIQPIKGHRFTEPWRSHAAVKVVTSLKFDWLH